MIEEGNGWKFTSHIDENAFYEDQLVEHIWTGHRSVRRVYSKRLNLDEEASRAVRRQITISSSIEHPGLQRLFFSEEVEGQFCVYGEHMDGATLETLVRHKTFVKGPDWAEGSLLLVDLMREFEAHGIGFDHLTLGSMKLRWNMLRVATRYPTGSLVPGRLPQSRFFRRLLETPEVGGVYLAEHGFPLEAGMQRLKDLLYFMATAQTVVPVAAALAKSQERLQETGSRSISMLGVDSEIEQILLRLHDPSGQKGISTLRDLRRAIALLAPGAGKPSVPVVASPPPAARPTPPTPAPEARARRVESTPPAATASESGEDSAVSSPDPAASSPRATSQPATKPMEMMGRSRLADDLDEDRSYLYPSSSSANLLPDSGGSLDSSSSSSSSQHLGSSGSLAKSPLPRSSSGSFRAMSGSRRSLPIKAIVLTLLVVAVLAGGGYGAMILLNSGKANATPLAAFVPPPEQININQPVVLDASPSSDEDGDPLRYQWVVEGLEVTNYSLRPNQTREAVNAELRIFVPGRYTITLTVFDGKNLSAPASHTVVVGN
ncbi:MAG: hypothetical protein PWP23_693 [Candidatus Sumerlaeota bacterium]|nr:hypothetical protein [Candidatus Sumerlaeota bacterium]